MVDRELSTKLGAKAITRPEIDISRKVWNGLFNEAFGVKLKPAFDPYTTGNHFLLAAYMLPYVSYTGYVSIGMHAEGSSARDVSSIHRTNQKKKLEFLLM